MRRFLLAAAAVVIVAAPGSAQVTTIDAGPPVQYLGPVGKEPGGATAIAQTFIAPTGASYLQGFSFFFTNFINGADLLLDASVYAFAGDHIDGPALFQSALVHGTNSTGDETLTFGGDPENPMNLLLAPGTTYALVLSSLNGFSTTPDGSSILVGVTDDTYAGGAFFASFAETHAGLSEAGAFIPDFAPDAAFNASFTETSVVATPEPATLTLLATGLAGLGGYVKRRKRA